jgi:hypothetical protein
MHTAVVKGFSDRTVVWVGLGRAEVSRLGRLRVVFWLGRLIGAPS